jgi:hypothetical protein
MRKSFTRATTAAWLICSASLALAGGPDLLVETSSPATISADPGSVLKAIFIVTHRSMIAHTLDEAVDLPPGWQLVTPERFSFDAETDGRTLRLLVIRVPRAYPAGSYTVTSGVRDRADSSLADQATVDIEITRQAKLSASAIESPEVVIAGEVWRSRLRITNEGNGSVLIRLDADAVPNADVEIEPAGAALGPAQSGTFVVSVQTDRNAGRLIRYTVDVEASPIDDGADAPSVAKTLWFDVVPWVTGDQDVYHRIPSRLKMIAALEDGHRRVQVDLSASGSLDESGSRSIAFLIRGPDIEHFGRYGKRDSYWLSYEDEHSAVMVGDRTYRLSHLTQRFIYGRGAKLAFRTGDFDFGCFYLEPRQTGPRPRRVGGRIAYEPDPDLAIACNLLVKTNDSTSSEGYTRSSVYSVEASVSHDDRVRLNAEYGMSDIGDPQSEEQYRPLEAHAYRLEARGRVYKNIRYAFERIYAGPHYTGYYQGTSQSITSLVFPIGGRLRGSLYYHAYSNDPAGLRIESLADKLRSLRSGLSYQLPNGFQASLDYSGYHKKDVLAPRDHDFHEKAAVLGLGKTFRKVSLHANLEYGIVIDHLTAGPAEELGRCNFSAHLRPTESQTYTLFTRVGNARFSETADRDWSAGLSARLRLGRRLRFHIDYVTNQKENTDTWRRNSLFSTITLELPNGHTCSLRGHYFEHNRGEGDRDGSLFLVYAIPFGLPTGRRASIGSLKGRVYDAELAGRPAMGGVVLSASGVYAISKANGEFTFPGLSPGSHFLQVEPRSIAADKVTTAKLPIHVQVTGGGTTELEVGVVTAGKVTGRVTMYRLAGGRRIPTLYSVSPGSGQGAPGTITPDIQLSELEDVGGVQVVVELTNGKEMLRQLTNRDGCFDFQQVRPGTWHVKFHENGIPDLHHIEQEHMVVELGPGEETYVAARVVPRVRPIRMIDGGRIKVAGTRR